MRDLSKFEFLNLLGIWLFQHVFVYERKDIPFYQFPAKADPSVRLFCFPSAQSRDSDRNNNYPSPPHLYPLRSFLSSFPLLSSSLWKWNEICFLYHSARLVADPNYRSLDLLPPSFLPFNLFLFSSNSLFLATLLSPREKKRKEGRESVGNGRRGLLHKRIQPNKYI